ncbi:MAG: succinate dehydrogenase, cytochrome b556 subunit [Pseudomonadota bacterium]
MALQQQADNRPLSPHIMQWKWHWTMAASISHRVSGVALYVGTVLIAAWAISAAMGPEAYATVEGFLMSWFGRLCLFGFTAAVTYHFANGIRHLVWDGPGAGFSPKAASAVSVFNFVFAILTTTAIWIAAYFA